MKYTTILPFDKSLVFISNNDFGDDFLVYLVACKVFSAYNLWHSLKNKFFGKDSKNSFNTLITQPTFTY